MKKTLAPIFLAAVLFSACYERAAKPLALSGTWKLISGTTITNGVSTVTDYTKDQEMIKIINGDHFAFLKHDLHAPSSDSSSRHFEAGGGSFELAGNQYVEHLDYCSDSAWEGQTFAFTVQIANDTLTQTGTEKLDIEGINRKIIEKYVRVVVPKDRNTRVR